MVLGHKYCSFPPNFSIILREYRFQRTWKMAAVSEKRRRERFEVKKPVRVFTVVPSKSGNIFEVDAKHQPGIAHNISESGLKLEVQRPFKSEAILKLNIELEKDQTIEVYAKIVWAKKTHCGVSFVLPDEWAIKAIQDLAKNSVEKEA